MAQSGIYDDSIVIDGLNVSRWDSQAVYDSLSNGRVTAINATIAIWEGFHETLDNTSAWMRRFRDQSATLSQVRTADDILRAKEQGKVGVALGWQNSSPIENHLDRLELFYEFGVRVIQITYNERNLVGNGCYERVDDGLSNFGVDVVKEMDRLGILVDLSHVGDQTTLEAIELSENPVACTHANARSFFDNPRNKTDDALRILAEKGGVVGANAFPCFLRNEWASTLSDYVDAIDDLVERIGIDHVGIGTDYTQDQSRDFFKWLLSRQGTIPLEEWIATFPDPVVHPTGMETPDKLAAVSRELQARGYSDEDIEKVLGGNWLRLFRQVWRG